MTDGEETRILVPAGAVLERDMHGGQQFAPMLDIELA